MFSELDTMLGWFGVPEATIMKVKYPDREDLVYVLQVKDICLDGEHPPEEALDSDITLMKKYCTNTAWKKINESCK